MSDSYLSRGGPEYARGYRDGENGKPHRYNNPVNPLDRPFGHYDYNEGFKAGANDTHWQQVFSGRATDIKTRQCGLSNGETFDLEAEGRRLGVIA